VDDDTAAMIITDSNLKHRDRLLPSERGFAYKMQLESLKKQGKRTDKLVLGTLERIAPKFRSAKIVAEHNAVTIDDIKRYIRLTYLIPELLSLVDNEILPLYAGIDLSFLDEASQRAVYDVFYEKEKIEIDLERSGLIKQIYKEKGAVTHEILNELFFERGEIQNRTIPLINRKMLGSLLTDVELPDDATLIYLFAEFLRDRFNARGNINVVRKTTEKVFG